VFGLVYLGVLAVLPVAGHWLRRDDGPFCAHDGGKIDARYRVRVVDTAGRDHEFCCIKCAEAWLAHEESPRAVFVTDEVTGQEVEAPSAFFVRGTAATSRVTGNRVHAFRSERDAEEHARLGGRLLTGSERPFSNK
jgi:hypothetical protein